MSCMWGKCMLVQPQLEYGDSMGHSGIGAVANHVCSMQGEQME